MKQTATTRDTSFLRSYESSSIALFSSVLHTSATTPAPTRSTENQATGIEGYLFLEGVEFTVIQSICIKVWWNNPRNDTMPFLNKISHGESP